MINVREATENDVEAIRELFVESYGDTYAYPQYYDFTKLKKMVFADNTLLLVAESPADGRVLGTASIVMHVGAYNDLVGEFGRLAVHPEARNQGIGHGLMQGRIECAQQRLQLGIVENRVVHPFSQKISAAHQFRCVGLLPQKLLTDQRESVALYVRYFGDGLKLRRNHPRVISEAHELAEMAMDNLGLEPDVIVDIGSSPYPHDDRFELQEFKTEGYSTLLRLQRGRVHDREVFGPLRLHYGLFQIRSRDSNYLVAREGKRLAGGVGFAFDPVEKTVRIFELISASDRPIRFLLENLDRFCREKLKVEYVEVDVSAHAPQMQRTFWELGYVPTAYVPALTFHQVERLDAVKMVRLYQSPKFGQEQLTPTSQHIANLVMRQYAERFVLPRIVSAAKLTALFSGLNEEQATRLAAAFNVTTYSACQNIYSVGDDADELFLILSGKVNLTDTCERPITELHAGASFGECSMLSETKHSATASAESAAEIAVLPRNELERLVRRHPDIAVCLYRNLARDVVGKLHQTKLRTSGVNRSHHGRDSYQSGCRCRQPAWR